MYLGCGRQSARRTSFVKYEPATGVPAMQIRDGIPLRKAIALAAMTPRRRLKRQDEKYLIGRQVGKSLCQILAPTSAVGHLEAYAQDDWKITINPGVTSKTDLIIAVATGRLVFAWAQQVLATACQ